MAETKEYLDYNGLSEYHKKAKDLFQDLTIQDVEEAFNELDESDPSYSAFYDVIQKAKEATANADSKAAAAVTATNNANTATSNADKATERANKAAEKLETVNDMTTGVNLLRGTRDFRLGTQIYNGGLYYSDGFKNSAYTFSKDEEGFTVATISSNGSSTNYLNGSVIPISGDDQVFTISIEFKVDSRIDNTSPIFFTMGLYKGDNSRVSSKEFNVSEVLGIPYSNLEIGKWYQLVVHYNITDSISDGYYLLPSISINGTGIKSVRKLMVQRGKINNPVYIPNPNDIDYINDITTEINLIRGSKDFRVVSTVQNDQGASDGWINPLNIATFSKDEDGYTIASLKKAIYVYSNNLIDDFKIGDKFTVAFEIMIDDVSAYKPSLIGGFLVRNSTFANVQNVPFQKSAIQNMQSGVWYQVIYHVDLTVSKNPGDIIELYLYSDGSSGVNFRKMLAYKGNINKPVYSINPADLALDTVNDMTTGINIIRGSRDFKSGSVLVNNFATRYSDGFYLVGNDPITFDEQGNGILSFNRSGYSGSEEIRADTCIVKLKNGTYTISFWFMCDDYSKNDSDGMCHLYDKSYQNDSTLGVVAVLEKVSVLPKNPQNGKWYEIKQTFTYNSTQEGNNYLLVRFLLQKNGSIHFTQPVLQRGDIHNPVYSISPSDLALGPVNDITTGINHIRNSLTFGSGRTTDKINPNFYSDGFLLGRPPVQGSTSSIEKDDCGNSVLHLYTPEGTSANNYLTVYTNTIYGFKKGDIVTISLDVKFENILPGSYRVASISGYKGTTRTHIKDVTPRDENKVLDEWTQHKESITINDNYDFLVMYLNLQGQGDVYMKKCLLYDGYIYNPEWSMCPLDVVNISDITSQYAGKNLMIQGIGHKTAISNLAANINLSEGEYRKPGQWTFLSTAINNISDMPSDYPANQSFTFKTEYVSTDETVLQVINFYAVGRIYQRAIGNSGIVNSWVRTSLN